MDVSKIKKAAFQDELMKIAGVRSEVVGSTLNPANWLLGGPAALMGFATGNMTQEEIDEVNKKMASNLLIPGVAPYRLANRYATMMSGGAEEGKKKHKKHDKD
jgi:hypothetical protein